MCANIIVALVSFIMSQPGLYFPLCITPLSSMPSSGLRFSPFWHIPMESENAPVLLPCAVRDNPISLLYLYIKDIVGIDKQDEEEN